MADSGQNQNQNGGVHDDTNLGSNGASTGSNYFDNMESLASAAHAQAQHAPIAGYNQVAAPPPPQTALDPIFYVTEQQQVPHAPQFYQTQAYTATAETAFGGSVEQWRTALGGGTGDFQQLMGHIGGQYPGSQVPPQQQQPIPISQAQAQPVQQQFYAQQQHTPNIVQRVQQVQQVQQQRPPPQEFVPKPKQKPYPQSLTAIPPIPTEPPNSASPRTERAESAKLSVATVWTVPDKTHLKNRADFMPKTSIPQNMTAKDYASECIQAAIASRLLPHALHKDEYQMLRKYLNHVQVTTYLHIRNGILRLWQRNPLVSVTREEAAGCAKDYRFFDMAEVAYDWLVRNGYINFGCIEVPNTISPYDPAKRRRRIVVIGAGIAGLGCARQLEGLFSQLGEKFSTNEPPPQVILLEARGRIGGRVYSHPFKDQSKNTLPVGKRATADLGAQVITGFENGNPLGVLVRGQLALEYHSVKGDSVLYDSNGDVVEKSRDSLVEKLFNDILDRVSIFKQRPTLPKIIEGDKELISAGKDPAGEGGRMIAEVEDGEVEIPAMEIDIQNPITISGQAPFSAGVDKFTGKPSTATGSSASIPAGEQIRKLGWELKDGLTGQESIILESQGADPKFPTLGKTMDYVLRKYQDLIEITPLDLRLINWHYANLEYANASNVDSLSLGYWDQDDGHEFAGAHSVLIGGYTQVPRGLWLAPKKLDVRPKHAVKKIIYRPESCLVECENGQNFHADKVVVTLPLGVLKAESVAFDPPLPEWKTSAIERLGFGLLNKLVLVYEKPFWDVETDMVGLLRNPMGEPANQENYEENRGRFYMFWNIYKASGKPALVALMAGESATQTERESDDKIIEEATSALAKMYAGKMVPRPVESIITRWRKDPYSRGSYSYLASEATAEDYDLMAKPVGPSLFFGGEATCRSHPATVHGAYLSGLRASAEVLEAMIGPLNVPSPLIPPKSKLDKCGNSGTKRKAENSAIDRARELKNQRLERHEVSMKEALVRELGERPIKPGRSGANPFLLYQKDKWFICKEKCDEQRRKSTSNPEAKATRNEVRAALGQMWRDAPEEERRPYLAETEVNKKNNAAGVEDFKRKLKDWDAAAIEFKKTWTENNTCVPSQEELEVARQAELEMAEIKRNRKLNGYLDDSAEEF